MGPGQIEPKLHPMPGPIVVRRDPGLLGVTEVAGRILEHPLMAVHVAGQARFTLRSGVRGGKTSDGEPQQDTGSGGPTGGMTGLAFGAGVGPHQVEAGAGMVEPSLDGTTIHSIPALGGVAGSATPVHPAFMGIFVTGGTVGSVHGLVANHRIFSLHLFCNVAPFTGRPLMTPLQGVGRPAMVELRGPTPLLLGMAGPTIFLQELATVGVFRRMTPGTLPGKAQVGPIEPATGGDFIEHLGVLDLFRRVAVSAAGPEVSSLQLVPGGDVGKGIRLHAYQVKVSAQVLFVANAAILLLESPMVSCTGCHPLPQGLVASEASRGIDSRLSELVALGAVPQAFQLFVDL